MGNTLNIPVDLYSKSDDDKEIRIKIYKRFVEIVALVLQILFSLLNFSVYRQIIIEFSLLKYPQLIQVTQERD